jgi:phosphatidylserine decarboxylase
MVGRVRGAGENLGRLRRTFPPAALRDLNRLRKGNNRSLRLLNVRAAFGKMSVVPAGSMDVARLTPWWVQDEASYFRGCFAGVGGCRNAFQDWIRG